MYQHIGLSTNGKIWDLQPAPNRVWEASKNRKLFALTTTAMPFRQCIATYLKGLMSSLEHAMTILVPPGKH